MHPELDLSGRSLALLKQDGVGKIQGQLVEARWP
jgi:hypothetical protein